MKQQPAGAFPFEKMADLVSDGILILLKGKLVYFNERILAWTGYSASELLNLELNCLAPVEEFPTISEMLQMAERSVLGKIQKSFSILHRNTSTRILVNAHAMAIAEGDWADHIIVTLRDVTEEKHIQKLLTTSQQHLQEIIETFPDIYYITDAKGVLIKVSPSVKTILGYEPHEVLGTPMSNYYENPEQRSLIVGQVLGGKGKYVRVEAPLLHKSGRAVWFNTRARILLDADGNITGLEGLARDSSAEKQIQDLIRKNEQELLSVKSELELKVQQQTEELLKKERLQLQKSRHEQMGEMISSIAHQWRQPLNVLSIWINNFGSIYKENGLHHEDVELFSQKANALICSMSQTIDEFRSFFSPVTEADVFEIDQAVSGVLKLIGPSLSEANIKVNYTGVQGLSVYGFSNEFGQVLINLLINAKESFVENRVADAKIEISLKSNGQEVVLEVSDNAGGIPAGVIEKMFDPYFTTKAKGTGIGLYMSKNIVERHMKGQISVTNKERGALFRIELPLSRKESAQPKTASTASGLVPATNGSMPIQGQSIDHLRVVFVDDNEEARVAFCMMLKKKGAEIKTAGSMAEAIPLILQFKPNLLISDILMPGEDGHTLVKELRSLPDPVLSQIPAIALSAHVDGKEVQQALDSGFNRYLTKPLDWKRLLKVILTLVPR